MIKFPLNPVKEGDPISARAWNAMVDWLRRNTVRTGQSTFIEVNETPDGLILKARDRPNRFLAVANGNITARSGSTAGSGSVYLVNVNASSALSTSSISYTVYNPSSNTMTSGNGIDSGMYCWIEEYPSGQWCVAPLECS